MNRRAFLLRTAVMVLFAVLAILLAHSAATHWGNYRGDGGSSAASEEREGAGKTEGTGKGSSEGTGNETSGDAGERGGSLPEEDNLERGHDLTERYRNFSGTVRREVSRRRGQEKPVGPGYPGSESLPAPTDPSAVWIASDLHYCSPTMTDYGEAFRERLDEDDGKDEEDIDWDVLWNEEYADEILMFDNPRDSFAIAQLILGQSLNTEDKRELRAAADLLKEQKKYVQAYVMDEIFDKMGAGEAAFAPYYAGDAVVMMEDHENLGFVIPESGTNLFVDALCIPKGAKNKEAAEMYMNFLCEPEAALEIADFIGYSTPNSGAFEMLDEEVQNDEISYPDDEFLNDKCEIFKNLSDDTNQYMQNLWTEIKTGG